MGLLDLQADASGNQGLLGSVLSRIDAMKRRAAGLLSPEGVQQLIGSIADDARANMNMAGQGLDASQSVMPGMASIGAQQLYQAGSPAAMGLMTVYHGSPHLFDKFDMSKIGTGEGAQAYGHGLYFAENPEVASSYKMAGQPSYLGATVWGHVHTAIETAKAHGLVGDGVNKFALDYLNKQAANAPPMARQQFYDAINNFDQLASASKPGRMYEVAIHADPEDFLNWDKPLSGQPHVQAAFDKLGAVPGPRWEMLPKTELMTGADRLSPAEASAALNQAGIPGIRYLDQGSRGAGEGTSNYVVFDPSLIEIVRKYGLAGLIASGAVAAGNSGGHE